MQETYHTAHTLASRARTLHFHDENEPGSRLTGELRTKYGFNIPWLDSVDSMRSENVLAERMPGGLDSLIEPEEKLLFFCYCKCTNDNLQAKGPTAGIQAWWRLTTSLFAPSKVGLPTISTWKPRTSLSASLDMLGMLSPKPRLSILSILQQLQAVLFLAT